MKLYRLLIPCIVILIVGCSLFLPSYILNRKLEKELNETIQAPREYYNTSTSAMSRELSSQMSFYEKMELITGIWPREIQEVDIADTDFDVRNYVYKTKSQIKTIYWKNLYESRISTDYDNWYTYDTSLYLCTDTTFNTYSTYYWVITFTKYDRSRVHHILLTNDGTLLCAYDCSYEEDVDILALYIESINNQTYTAYYQGAGTTTQIIQENDYDAQTEIYTVDLDAQDAGVSHIGIKVATEDTCLFFRLLVPEEDF